MNLTEDKKQPLVLLPMSKKREMLHNWDLIKNRAERKQLSHLIINPIKHSRIHGFLKIN